MCVICTSILCQTFRLVTTILHDHIIKTDQHSIDYNNTKQTVGLSHYLFDITGCNNSVLSIGHDFVRFVYIAFLCFSSFFNSHKSLVIFVLGLTMSDRRGGRCYFFAFSWWTMAQFLPSCNPIVSDIVSNSL